MCTPDARWSAQGEPSESSTAVPFRRRAGRCASSKIRHAARGRSHSPPSSGRVSLLNRQLAGLVHNKTGPKATEPFIINITESEVRWDKPDVSSGATHSSADLNGDGIPELAA